MVFFKGLLVQYKSIALIFLVTALISIATTIIELIESRKEMLNLLERQSETLLETVLISSNNALISYENLEEEIRDRLFNNAALIKLMFEQNTISNRILYGIASGNNIHRINIFDASGRRLFFSHDTLDSQIEVGPKKYLKPIFNGETDTLIIGVKETGANTGQKYAIAVAAKKRTAIVLSVDTDQIQRFRNQIGFGTLLRNLTDNKNILFASLQSEDGIIAASGDTKIIATIDSSYTPIEQLEEGKFKWRIVSAGEADLFEAFLPFVHKETLIGTFRLGLSLETFNHINSRNKLRVIIVGLIFFVLGFILISFLFVKQNFELLTKKFRAVETYSKNIIENVSDGIIVLDEDFLIKSINRAAEVLLGKKEADLIGQSITVLLPGNKCTDIIENQSTFMEVECEINSQIRTLLISKSSFQNEKKKQNTILVVKDLTDLKSLEKQMERNEIMATMGKLASSVAHEIRNPLNAIGTITQQLGKDFLPAENQDEFLRLTQIVYHEVHRINEAIESFLKFARPKGINPQKFDVIELAEQLRTQYSPLLSQRKINFSIEANFSGSVVWDKTQMMQALINLMENSIDSIGNDGEIKMIINENGRIVEIVFKDSGRGIPPENIDKIFNLYFTTKPNGSGIGLSIVQKIISEHGGSISVKNEDGGGAVFTIQLPKNLPRSSQ